MPTFSALLFFRSQWLTANQLTGKSPFWEMPCPLKTPPTNNPPRKLEISRHQTSEKSSTLVAKSGDLWGDGKPTKKNALEDT